MAVSATPVSSDYFSPHEPSIFRPLLNVLFAGYYMHHKAILNVAASGRFSSDRRVAGYATEIWHARPCPVA